MWNLITVPLAVIVILKSGSAYSQQKSSYIYDFPPLYKLDDYDSCLAQKHNNISPTYCMVYAEVKPNKSSDIWHQMVEHYQEYPFRYRRDRLFFGVCVEKCQKNSLNITKTKELFENNIIKNDITDYFDRVHKRPLDLQFRKKYHYLIHNCINNEFQQKYDLDLRTYIEYCERPRDIKSEETNDHLENVFYKILGVIFILNILSSLYDFCSKLQQPENNQTNEFYKINPQETVPKLLTSFSITRNYYRLIQPYFSDIGKDFKFLDCYRSVCMMLCLYGHTYYLEFQNIGNPEYFEKSAQDENKLWILNTTMIIEIYFVMSGLFLYIKYQQGSFVTPQTSWKQFILIYMKLMVFRYIRFIPSLALFLLSNATVMSHLQDGPFWRHITEPLRVFSRENGWKNILMMNNFYTNETTGPHTWYLAADWQLFALYLLVIMILSKYPKYKKHIYSSIAILSFIIPFSISYLLKLEPCFVIKPESYRYTFFKDINVYLNIYTPFYTNLFGYLFGILCAEIYLKYTRTEMVRKFMSEQPKYTIAAYFTTSLCAFFLFWLGSILDVRSPSLWSALYAGLHRQFWNIFICGVPLLLMTCKCGWIAYQFCCLPIFRLLARLSFQVYIWHMSFMYLTNGYYRQPYHVNDFNFFTQFIVLYSLSNLLAFVIALFIEYPLAQCIQVLQSKRSNKNTKNS